MPLSESLMGRGFVVAAAMLWGTNGTAQALAPIDGTPLAIGALRLLVGGIVLLGVAINARTIKNLVTWQRTPLIMSSVMIAAYQVFFFTGVARTGVAVGTIVGIGSAPISAGVLAWFFRGEMPDLRWGIATLLAIIGAALLVMTGDAIEIDLLGMVLSILAGVSYAAYTLSSKLLMDKQPPSAVVAVTFTIGAVLLLPLLILADLRWVGTPQGAVVVLHVGIIATGLAYVFYAQGLRTTPVSTTVTLSLAEPLTAGVLGILVLQEPITALAALGMGLILFGLVVLALPDRLQSEFEKR